MFAKRCRVNKTSDLITECEECVLSRAPKNTVNLAIMRGTFIGGCGHIWPTLSLVETANSDLIIFCYRNALYLCAPAARECQLIKWPLKIHQGLKLRVVGDSRFACDSLPWLVWLLAACTWEPALARSIKIQRTPTIIFGFLNRIWVNGN